MISLIVVIAVIGLIVYLLTSLIPMPAPFVNVIYAVAALIVLIYVLRFFGLLTGAVLS